jgi:UDP-glucose 4-epimerase
MDNSRVIMVTGVAAYWGDQLSRHLLHDTTNRVIGVDQDLPERPLHERLDFVQADVRNRLLADLLALEQVDTVYHLDRSSGSGRLTLELAPLLAACAQAGVRHLIWVSSTAVYGSLPTNPAFISEHQPPYSCEQEGPVYELVAAETLCYEQASQYPDLRLTILRPANIIGPQAPSPLNRYLAGPVAPMLLGFDPLLQFIYEEDLLLALVHAFEAPPLPAAGERIPPNLHHYNIAAEGLLPLTRLLSLTHTWPLPLAHPLAYWGSSLLRATPWSAEQIIPYGWDYLRYRWVGATERQAEWGFVPRQSGVEAVMALAQQKQQGGPPPRPSDLALDELRLQQILAQRRKVKKG